jgi:hypothetical protein
MRNQENIISLEAVLPFEKERLGVGGLPSVNLVAA